MLAAAGGKLDIHIPVAPYGGPHEQGPDLDRDACRAAILADREARRAKRLTTEGA